MPRGSRSGTGVGIAEVPRMPEVAGDGYTGRTLRYNLALEDMEDKTELANLGVVTRKRLVQLTEIAAETVSRLFSEGMQAEELPTFQELLVRMWRLK